MDYNNYHRGVATGLIMLFCIAVTFEKKRVDWTENNEEIVIFRSKSNERKYLSGHEHGHTVNGEVGDELASLQEKCV